MKPRGARWAPLLAGLLSFGCRSTTPEAQPEAATAPPPARAPEAAASLDDALSSITAARLRGHIEVLADDDMRGRPTPSPELDAAAAYIAQTFEEVGASPLGASGYETRVRCGGVGGMAANVLALLPGSTNDYVMVSAHYDHVGESSSGDDRIFNGANDNASGVAGVLAIAEALARAPGSRRRGIVFAAFCGEEVGLQGSSAYVRAPAVPIERTIAMFNLEMLGHPDPADAKRAWVSGHRYSNLPQWLDRGGAPEGVTFVPGAEIGRTESDVFDRSDNYPLALQGVVAHTIAAGPLDEHYHAVTDDLSNIDADAMVPIVRALARAVDELAREDGLPRWLAAAPRDLPRRGPLPPGSSTPP
ncbi:MAG: M28 family peptidase [Myxococcota bacterium]